MICTPPLVPAWRAWLAWRAATEAGGGGSNASAAASIASGVRVAAHGDTALVAVAVCSDAGAPGAYALA